MVASVSYAADPAPIWRGAGEYSGLVLNGAKPGDLPIQTSAMQVTVNLKTAKTLAGELSRQAPVAMRYIIDAINHGLEMPFAQGRVFEATLFGLVAATEDMREGTRAFLEKRKAEFKGR